MTHKRIEQTEKTEQVHDQKNKTSAESSSSQVQEIKSLEIKSNDHGDSVKKEIPAGTDDQKTQGDHHVELSTMDDTTAFLNNYETLCGNMEVGSWLNSQETNTSTNNSCSTSSFSWEDQSSYNPSISMGESPPNNFQEEDNSLQQWIDNVDSFLSWDCFNQLEDNLFLLEN